jgi:hypothetical protein
MLQTTPLEGFSAHCVVLDGQVTMASDDLILVLPCSRPAPRIKQSQVTVCKIADISRRQFRASYLSDGGDLCIRVTDRSTQGSTLNGNFCKRPGRVALEAKDAACEIVRKHGLRRLQEGLAPFALCE